MRKMMLGKDIRFWAIALCLALIGVLAALFYMEFKFPGFKEKIVPLYNYESKDTVNYEVFLKPNSLYDAKSLSEDQIYISNIVDYINMDFNYEFIGEREAEIKGNYEVVAVVEGYNGYGEDKLITLWRKQFPLVTKTGFNTRESKLSLTKSITFRLDDYSAFVEKIKEESKIMSQAKVTTYMNVELNVKTDEGDIAKNVNTSLEVPLLTNYFKINKKQGGSKVEAIETAETVPQPINKKMLIGYGTGMVLLVVVLLGLIFGTKAVKTDPYVKGIRQLFKKYGNRLVAMNGEIAASSEYPRCVTSIEDLLRINHELSKPIIKVKSMDDLIKVADEVGKPIMYKYSAIPKKITALFVFDDSCTYFLDLKDVFKFGKNIIYQMNSESITRKDRIGSENPNLLINRGEATVIDINVDSKQYKSMC